MRVQGIPYRTIWLHPNAPHVVRILDQRALPHRFVIEDIHSADQMTRAIKEMHLRGAPLIGVAAAYGVYLAALEAPRHREPAHFFEQALSRLAASRPTAVNLAWALEKARTTAASAVSWDEKINITRQTAEKLADEDVQTCEAIGRHSLSLIETLHRKKNAPVNILTHCNAGWLACVDWGTATSGIYQAHNKGIPVHVWVDETRPRNQGASLTAWELASHGIAHTVIADNAGGHLMQHGRVDMVLVGSDRTTRTGDVANKIGTYLKALAARDNRIPFYVALPSSTLDWNLGDGLQQIPIEERSADEVRKIQGLCGEEIREVLLTPEASPAANPAFDVTPAHLVTGLITERGICEASEAGLLSLFPEKASARDEGVIKFVCEWTPADNPAPEAIQALNACRSQLFDLGLIGVYPDGIGFGNASVRGASGEGFLITGTQTGNLPRLNPEHYTRVTSCDLEKNKVLCEGPVKASSESLTHAMLYAQDAAIRAVLHVHHAKSWKGLLGKVPTTSEKIPYGTPAMAHEVERLFKKEGLGQKKIFVMAGHEDGIVSFGSSVEEALEVLLAALKPWVRPAQGGTL